MFRNAINFLKTTHSFRKANSFLKDRRGNIIPIFAFAMVPTVGMIGAAVDYSRAANIRTAMQAALDSSTLAIANTAPSLTDEQLKTAAEAYFNSVFKKSGTTGVDITAKYTTTNGSQLTMTAETSVPTDFMGIPGLGIKSIPIKAQSTTAWGNRRLRVALALDNTGSMSSSGKMDALKKAAKGLIDQLKTAATKDGDVYVSIIPFAKDVNVGTGNRSAAWLTFDSAWDATKYYCSKAKKNGNTYDTKKECQDAGGTWKTTAEADWTGCVTDRDKPYDTTNAAPSTANGGVTLFQAEQYAACPVALLPLTYNWNTLKSKIDAMTPTGNTNTTIGLEWAWHSLSQGAPLNAPAEDSDYQYKKIIIFLTDGDNTQNRWDTQQSKIDARMKLACANAKTADIEIYTILVMQGSESLLKDCASSKAGTSDHYFKITKSDQMVSVFDQIGTQISRLRVAK